jgi:hypothetical protein
VSGNSIYRKAILVYLMAIVTPALVLLYFGVASFQRQRQAVDTLLRSNLRLSGERLAVEVESRATELARACLRGDWGIGRRKHPVARYFFASDRGQVTYPPLHMPPPSTVDDLLPGEPAKIRREYAEDFGHGELLELRERKLEAALANYRKASSLEVSGRLRALALQRVARCMEKLKQSDETRKIYQVLGEKYGDLMDLSNRPYALVSALALNAPAAKKAALWQDLARGRWQLSAEQLEYFAPLLGGRMDSNAGPYVAHLRFASGLEEQFRQQGHLQPDAVYSFAFGANGEQYQTFYRMAAGGSEDHLLGFAVDPDWVRQQVAAAGGRLVRKGEPQKEEIRAGFSSLFPFWDLALPAPAANPASGGPLLQGAITGLVLCLLLMGVVLLIRDLSRDARLNQLRSDFVGAVSHELKTPITVIRLYGETLLDDDNFSPAQRKEFYQIITRESDRLSQLVEKVLPSLKSIAARSSTTCRKPIWRRWFRAPSRPTSST